MTPRESSNTERNFLHGYFLHDIFGDYEAGLPIIRGFFYAFKCASRTMMTRATLVNDYFYDLLLWKTKDSFRTTLLVLVYFMVMYILDAILLAPVPFPFPSKIISFLLILHLTLYLLTFKRLSHRIYTKLSFMLCLITVVVNCWAHYTLLSQNSIVYTPYFGFILAMGVLLPIKCDLAITISAMMFCGSLMLQIHRRSIVDILKAKQDPEFNNPVWHLFDSFRYMRSPSTYHLTTNTEHVCDSLLWLGVFFIAMYLKFWNELRQKFVFFKLGESVTARNDAQKALKSKLRWIDAIMPSQVTTEYYKLKKLNEDRGVSMWVYSKTFDNVSILFADIVGFTKMSSNRTAYQVVMLLNDLFSRFDQLCQVTKCEKIGTLGDCYYCVAGCPQPQSDHAVSCVEMGLGMCRIIKMFNCDHYESVGMRVGVHTGRVNAAIIGSQRFRYDVYSYDVIIANNLESSGKPGRVHISETTFNEVKASYNVSVGEDLKVRKEEVYGIAGSTLTDTVLKTYFVDPRSSLLRRKHETFNEKSALRSINRDVKSIIDYDLSDSDLPSFSIATDERETARSHFASSRKSNMDKVKKSLEKDALELERDIELIETLHNDPEHQVGLFRSPPLDPITLHFLNPETEWHYQEHTKYCVIPTYIDSQKVAPLADIIALLIACSCIQTVCVFQHAVIRRIHLLEVLIYFLIFSLDLLCGLIVIFHTTTYLEQLQSPLAKRLYRLFNHVMVKELCLATLTLTPTLNFIMYHEATIREENAMVNYEELAKLSGMCLLIHCVPISSASWCRMICASITLITMHFEPLGPRAPITDEQCPRRPDLYILHSMSSASVLFSAELLCCFYFVSLITRENERNCRLCFFVNREAEIAYDLSDIAVNEAQDMLFNVIPKHVYDKLQLASEEELTVSSLSYATTLKNVGVMFACISNFFSHYYREDYHGGERSLRLLNSVICSFDSIVTSPAMQSVDKIKTINDCYMAAGGLDQQTASTSHFVDLMELCHLLKEELDKFNEMYIVGLENFTLKIGYNFGPVTAGIIGTTKPLFDIWGDTVNVASRMYSTGSTGQIQAPSYVVPVLQDYFDFKYRGEIFVKGKGDMATYICTRKKNTAQTL